MFEILELAHVIREDATLIVQRQMHSTHRPQVGHAVGHYKSRR
jgi:hypothetical protein